MQLVKTNVHDGDGSTTVVFAGEGGEEVSVRMAAVDLTPASAIMRAKETMVQLTTFDEDVVRRENDEPGAGDEHVSEDQNGLRRRSL